jgi:Uma2 family endonuclease
MTAEQFITWAAELPDGERYELVAGEAVAMSPERAVHARVKARVHRALTDGLTRAGLPCEAFPDGMAVRIDESTVYEPDALVRCGPPLDDDAITLEDPVIIVEVLSPSTRARDSGAKLEDYFRLPTLRHYLIVKTETRKVIHHARDDEGRISTRIVGTGALELSPPGLTVAAESFFMPEPD